MKSLNTPNLTHFKEALSSSELLLLGLIVFTNPAIAKFSDSYSGQVSQVTDRNVSLTIPPPGSNEVPHMECTDPETGRTVILVKDDHKWVLLSDNPTTDKQGNKVYFVKEKNVSPNDYCASAPQEEQ